jgi:hypothetical protein
VDDISLTSQERHQLLAVLREMDGNAPKEKRREPRRNILMRMWIRPIAHRKCGRQRATLLNVASRGVGLMTLHALEKRQKFLLPLRFHDGGGWLVLCEVRSCVPAKDGYKIGAKFLDRIDDLKGNAPPPMDWVL